MNGSGVMNSCKALAMAVMLASFSHAAFAQDWHSSSSLMGESKYGQSFQHYDYVNPDAPKGGQLNLTVIGTFDSFNPYIVRGTPAAGLSQFGGGLLYETLMEQSTDEPGVSHALIADAYKHPDDFSSATYRLNPDARWHDGKPITVDDVIWSLKVLRENSPMYARYYENVTEAVALNDREVEFRFDQKGNRELPKIMGDLAVLPKHWWEGKDAKGNQRDITQPTLEPPLGSAAYKIASFKAGSEIMWERVPDYWGAKLPVKVGRENFERRRYSYFLDDNAAWQAFTKGGLEDIQEEYISRRWATGYGFPAVNDGDVIKKAFVSKASARFQGFVINTRKAQFQDVRVRHALTNAFDFETLNRTTFFDSYERTKSFFVGGELASSGLPEGKELEILEAFRDQLPEDLFTKVYDLPVYGTPKDERANLQETVKLFGEAGWTIKGGKMINAESGAQFKLEILGRSSTDEIVSLPYINMLKKIGIDASLRIVDTSQYVNRVNNFDYDMISTVLAQSESPGNEQRDFWSSRAADVPGSRNLSGIKSPVVDALVERIVFATDREDLLAATHALDRVLLWSYYVIPQYYRAERWLAYWNKFDMTDKQPDYLGPDLDSWWIDPQKEQALSAKYKSIN